jgi:proline dehydrogenase
VSLLDRTLVRTLPAVPRTVVKRLSSRYIAGPELHDAVRVVKDLNARGRMATIDVLGEEIHTHEEATALAGEYERVFGVIRDEGLDANVSVKPTGLGLKLDYDLCRDLLARLTRRADEDGRFVRIDMEDATTTSDTLSIYRELRELGLGSRSVGPVLQARLRRTLDDVESIADLKPSVRICKGIYLEPEAIAFQGFDEIRENFVAALDALLDAGAYVAIATHDEWLVEQALGRIHARRLERDEYEFQMLLGVAGGLGERLVESGHRLRIYVPYGRRWYEYSMRRLQENPQIAMYVARDTLGRLVPGRNGS